MAPMPARVNKIHPFEDAAGRKNGLVVHPDIGRLQLNRHAAFSACQAGWSDAVHVGRCDDLHHFEQFLDRR